VLYGADRKIAEKEMKDVLDFEFALADVRIFLILSRIMTLLLTF